MLRRLVTFVLLLSSFNVVMEALCRFSYLICLDLHGRPVLIQSMSKEETLKSILVFFLICEDKYEQAIYFLFLLHQLTVVYCLLFLICHLYKMEVLIQPSELDLWRKVRSEMSCFSGYCHSNLHINLKRRRKKRMIFEGFSLLHRKRCWKCDSIFCLLSMELSLSDPGNKPSLNTFRKLKDVRALLSSELIVMKTGFSFP